MNTAGRQRTQFAKCLTNRVEVLTGIFGYAAEKIASNLERNGWTIIVSPKGFFVKGKNGPLKSGELERATDWSREIS